MLKDTKMDLLLYKTELKSITELLGVEPIYIGLYYKNQLNGPIHMYEFRDTIIGIIPEPTDNYTLLDYKDIKHNKVYIELRHN